jgi:hypothetical protein
MLEVELSVKFSLQKEKENKKKKEMNFLDFYG